MKFLLLLLLILNAFANASDKPALCEQDYPELYSSFEIDSFLKAASSHYLYFEADRLQDLQEFKNCLDYSVCMKHQESLVDDPKNFRMHIWTNLSHDQLRNIVETCPVKDLHKKLVVRKDGQKGQKVSIKQFTPYSFGQMMMRKSANPAFFHKMSEKSAKAMVSTVGSLLKQNQIKQAQELVLASWGIDLHGYKMSYTGKPGSYAVTFHGKKTIEYGKAWTDEPCEYIRMIRHEAEHVAQMNRAKACGKNHNFDDHKMRERAAYLNDALFMDSVCPNTKNGERCKHAALDYFRSNYFNHGP